MSLGDNLKELREDNGLKQEELGAILGLSKSTLSAYEGDVRKPNVDVLVKYAQRFRVSVDYLLGLSAEPMAFSCLSAEYFNGVPLSAVIKSLLRLGTEQRRALLTILESIQPNTENGSTVQCKKQGNRKK